MQKPDKKVFLISGAAGGLGSALVRQCAESGQHTILLDKNKSGLETLYDQISGEYGMEPLLLPMDLEGAGPDDYTVVVEEIDNQLGRLDGLIHCAVRFSGLTPHEHMEPSEWLRVFQANINGPWLLTKSMIPLLRKQQSALLIFMLENLQKMNSANWSAYGISKHALLALIHQLREELQHLGIQVCGINPGPMLTTLRTRAYMYSEDQGAADPADIAKRVQTIISSVASPAALIDFEAD